MSHGPANWIRDTADLTKSDAVASGSRSPPDPHFLPPPNLRKSQLFLNKDSRRKKGAKKSFGAAAAGAQVVPYHEHRPATMVDPIFDYQFRLILIGDSTVGKSSLLRYFTDGTFAEVSDPTVGVDFFARLVQVNDGTNIKLQLWDTAGQERFRSITKSYYRNSVGALLVYDICNRDSYKHIPVWMMEAKRHIEPHKAVFILVGCKLDLAADEDQGNREVTTQEARDFAAYHGIGFAETSAKTGQNVEEAFQMVTQQIYDKIQTGEYRLEDGWDGIKKGYFGLARRSLISRPGSSSSGSGGGGAGRTNTVDLTEGEPAHQCC